jgi:hypothetical protein
MQHIDHLRHLYGTYFSFIGHAKGLSSILVPGAGEPKFDSAEADPFENRKGRQEREVRALLDKVMFALTLLSYHNEASILMC